MRSNAVGRRSRSIAHSNSAKAPAIRMIIRPAGLAISAASVKLRNPTSLWQTAP